MTHTDHRMWPLQWQINHYIHILQDLGLGICTEWNTISILAYGLSYCILFHILFLLISSMQCLLHGNQYDNIPFQTLPKCSACNTVSHNAMHSTWPSICSVTNAQELISTGFLWSDCQKFCNFLHKIGLKMQNNHIYKTGRVKHAT